MEKTLDNLAVDEEWIMLIMNAKHLGISVEEIREFLNSTGK
ncbi:anti-repressor SinI family protein [Oceanobacillus rekensis]|nr:anti-repressor SinI family protein [Oceanobacillus rekensis]